MMRCNCRSVICDRVVATNEHQQPCCRCTLSNYNSVSGVSGPFLLHGHSWTSPLSNPKPGWVYLGCRCPQRQRHTCLLIQAHVYLKPWLTRWVLICAEKGSARTQFRNAEIRPAVSSYSATQSLARPLKLLVVVLMVSWLLLSRSYADMTNAPTYADLRKGSHRRRTDSSFPRL